MLFLLEDTLYLKGQTLSSWKRQASGIGLKGGRNIERPWPDTRNERYVTRRLSLIRCLREYLSNDTLLSGTAQAIQSSPIMGTEHLLFGSQVTGVTGVDSKTKALAGDL